MNATKVFAYCIGEKCTVFHLFVIFASFYHSPLLPFPQNSFCCIHCKSPQPRFGDKHLMSKGLSQRVVFVVVFMVFSSSFMCSLSPTFSTHALVPTTVITNQLIASFDSPASLHQHLCKVLISPMMIWIPACFLGCLEVGYFWLV